MLATPGMPRYADGLTTSRQELVAHATYPDKLLI